jgi:hypothetical protein
MVQAAMYEAGSAGVASLRPPYKLQAALDVGRADAISDSSRGIMPDDAHLLPMNLNS